MHYNTTFHCIFFCTFFLLDFCRLLKLLEVTLQRRTQRPGKDAFGLSQFGHPEDGKDIMMSCKVFGVSVLPGSTKKISS